MRLLVVIFDPFTATSARFLGHENDIRSIRFSSDGQRMVTGASDQIAIVWDFATGDILHVIFESSTVLDAMFTLDDTAILTIIEDGVPALWRSTPFTLDETIAWAIDNRSVRDPVESECRRYQIEASCNP